MDCVGHRHRTAIGREDLDMIWTCSVADLPASIVSGNASTVSFAIEPPVAENPNDVILIEPVVVLVTVNVVSCHLPALVEPKSMVDGTTSVPTGCGVGSVELEHALMMAPKTSDAPNVKNRDSFIASEI
jgi:hypothetical protein